MNAKRYRKMDAVAKKYRMFRRFGDEKADIGILSWGSSAGVVHEAIDRLTARGLRVAAFVPQMLMPLPNAKCRPSSILSKDLVVELSHSQQFHNYLRTVIDLPRDERDSRALGRQDADGVEVIAK